MPANLRRSLMLASLTLSFGFAGASVPASAAAVPAAEPPPTAPAACSTNLLVVTVDPCSIVGSLQELAAYGLEDVGKELGMDALQGVNLINVCTHPSTNNPAPPASILNVCPLFGGQVAPSGVVQQSAQVGH